MEGNHQPGDSNLLSKSLGPSIKINSISIDLVRADDEISKEKCEHFSIRGYVTEMRKRDWKKCWPFALDCSHDKFEEQTCTLPPLSVPNFRWSHCQNCLQEICVKDTASDNDIQQAPIPIAVKGKQVDAAIPAILHRNDCLAAVAKIPFRDENKDQEIPMLTSAAEVVSSPTQEINHTDDRAINLKTNCNRPVGSFKHGDNQEVADIEVTNGNLNCMGKTSKEIYQTGKEASVNVQHAELILPSGSYDEVAGMVDEASDLVKSHPSEHPSMELDKCDNASSENSEILARNRHQDHHHDNEGSVHRRKTRKVRLLTELLGKNGDAINARMGAEDSRSNAISEASAGVDMPSTLQGQVAVIGNVARGVGQNRKRRLPQDEEWRPKEIRSINSVHKKVRICNVDAETTSAAGSSGCEDNTFSGIGLQTGIKSHWINTGVNRVPIKGKQKIKKAQVVNESLPLALPRENLLKDNQNKTVDVSKGNFTDIALFKSMPSVLSGRELVPCPLHAQKLERKSSSCKKKNKIPQVDDGLASQIHWHNGMLGESSVIGRDVEVLQSKLITVPCQAAPDASTEKGLDLSLNSFLASQRYDRKYYPELKDGPASSLPWQEGIHREGQSKRKDMKTNCARDLSFLSIPEPVGCLQKEVNFDLSDKGTANSMSFLNEKQQCTPLFEVGGCSLAQQKDSCGGSSNKTTIEIQEHSAFTRKRSDQTEKVPEQLVPDDIPMEIVELMAKNQYERCLPDAEDEKQTLQATKNSRNLQIMDLNKIYGNGKLNLLLEETAQKPKPRAKNGRNSEITRGKNVLTAKQKPVDCFSHGNQNQYNMSQLGQNYVSTGFAAFSQNREKPSSSIQFSATGSSGQSSSHNCQWIANMVGQRSPQTTFRTLGTCNTCQSQNVLQQCKEPAHPWSSVIPNRMPITYNMPQRCMDQSSNMDVPSCPTSNLLKGNTNGDHDLNFLNLNVTSPEKHCQKFDSETLSRPHAEYPFVCKHSGMGSVDLYSNETIPAMHLLSLMDARLRSGRSIDLNGNPKFPKRPSFPHGHNPMEFSGLPSGGYKASNAMKHSTFDCHGKSSLESFHAVPAVGASAFSFQEDKGFKKASDFTTLLPFKAQEKEKRKESNSSAQNRGHRSKESVFANGDFGSNLGSFPVPSMQKLFLGNSGSMGLPMKLHAIKNATKEKLGAQNTNGTVWPLRICSRPEICSVNRNPADFTLPEAGNAYMIRGEDLKFRKSAGSGNRSGLFKSDGQKRRNKLMAAKGHA